MSRGKFVVLGAVCSLLVAYGCATGVENPGSGGDDDDGGAGGVGAAGGAGGSMSQSGGATSSSSSSSAAVSASSSSTGGIVCGNGMCEAGESCQTCPSDCGSCCGNGVCDVTESCATCPNDCFVNCCGDGICGINESCATCGIDCCCGNFVCDPGDCFMCPFDCMNNECCGDGMCTFFEDCMTCASDCGPNCCPSPAPGDPSGPSIFVFANYDGGQFTISIDANVPNIVIGLVSYIGMNVTITGPFVANVTAVRYIGFDDVPGTTVSGVPPGIVTIDQLPPATLMDPSGNPSMVCQYQGGCGDQGGCNTSAQVKDWFHQTLGGNVISHMCQYDVYMGTLSTNVVVNCP